MATIIYDKTGKPKAYISKGKQIGIGSKADTKEAQDKAGVNIKVSSPTNTGSSQAVGVYDLGKGQTRQATPYEALASKEIGRQSGGMTPLNPQSQTLQEYATSNIGKQEKVYFNSQTQETITILQKKAESPKPTEQKKSGKQEEKLTPFQERVQYMVDTENKITGIEQNIYTKIGINQNPQGNYFIEQAKGVVRFPLSVPGGLFKLEQRGGLAVNSLFVPEGRQELKNAFGRVPGAIKEQYNYKNPDFIANVIVTGLMFKSALNSAQTNYNIKHSNKFGVTKDYTITQQTQGGGITSESYTQGIQKIGKIEYKIKSQSKGININKGDNILSKINTKSEIISKGKVKANIESSSIAITKNTKTTTLTKQGNTRTINIIISKEGKQNIKYSGVQFVADNSLKNIKPVNAYAGVSKNVFENTRTTESGAFFDKTILTKSGQINTGLRIDNNIRPSASQIKALNNFKSTPAGGGGVQVQGDINTFQASSLANKNLLIQTAKGIYAKENIKPITPAFIDFSSQKTQQETITQISEVEQPRKPVIQFKPISDNKYIIKPETIIISETKPGQVYIPQGKTGAKNKGDTKPQVFVEQNINTEISQQEINQAINRTPNRPRPFTITQTPRIKTLIPKAGVLNLDNKKGSGFNVLIRRKGVFTKANIKPLTKSQALSFGAYKVGQEASASFKIVPTTEEATGTFKGGFSNLFTNYYQSKKEAGVFIQKRSKRISSIGEKQQITYKGLQSIKFKKRLFGVL